jgi:predicted nucleotidyltransferase
MINIEEIKLEIVQRLKKINPEKIILFGSYAYGNPDKDSDIDLYVVTKDDILPNSFDEKMKIKLLVSHQLKELKKKHDIDLIVHTRPMHETFVNMNSLFYQEISRNGERLL